MADKSADGGPWTGCAVVFLQSLCPAVNLLSLYKDQQEGKFIVFKVIKLMLIGEAFGVSLKKSVFSVTSDLSVCTSHGQILPVV